MNLNNRVEGLVKRAKGIETESNGDATTPEVSPKVRQELVTRARREILSGIYDTTERLDGAVEKMLNDVVPPHAGQRKVCAECGGTNIRMGVCHSCGNHVDRMSCG